MKTILFKKSLWFTVIMTSCLVLVTLFAAVSCDKSDILPKTDTDVSFTPCQPSKLRSSGLSDKVDVEFTNKGVQITHYDFEVPCDFTTVNVNHTLVNGVLDISQQGTPNQADCICYTDVSYTIDGISQNEVNVIFINGAQVYCYNENYPNKFGNPLTDLPWLKSKVEEITLIIQSGNPLSVSIYQCIYGNNEIGFLIDEGNMKPFYNCSGDILCIMGGFAGETCLELNIISEELIWEINN